MDEAKRLTHYMTVSPIAFRSNLCLSPTSAHTQARGIRPYRPYLLVVHRFLRFCSRPSIAMHHRAFDATLFALLLDFVAV
jgi:hypothetical protein